MPDVASTETRTVRIPNSAVSRRERTYAQLVLRVTGRLGQPHFEGPFFRCGTGVDETALRPNDEFPEIPLLIEFVGRDIAGGLHKRGDGYGGRQYRYLHILWRWNAARGEWDEVARVVSEGAEWLSDLAPIVRREIVGPPVAHVRVAGEASDRVLKVLDAELDALEAEGRGRCMAFLYDQFTARMTEHV